MLVFIKIAFTKKSVRDIADGRVNEQYQLVPLFRGIAQVKLFAKVPTTNAQPSIKTNNIILNGKDIINGDNIIIPIAIKMLAMTKSIIKNGMNSKNPI